MPDRRSFLYGGMVTGALLTVTYATAQRIPSVPPNLSQDEQIKFILKKSLDESLRIYTMDLFRGWMQDPRDQPSRASAGLRKAVNTYKLCISLLEDFKP